MQDSRKFPTQQEEISYWDLAPGRDRLFPMDDARKALGKFIKDRLVAVGSNMRQASKKLGRSDAYIQQFIERGSPEVLPEQVRHDLAALLRVPEAQLKVNMSKGGDATKIGEDNAATLGNDASTVLYGTVSNKEARMGEETFNEAVLKDLMKRLSRVEHKLFGDNEEAPAKKSDPPFRRKL